MPDAWTNATLGSLLSGLSAYVTGALGSLGQSNSKIQQTLATINSRLSEIASFLSSAQSLLDKLNASGFYIITLAPGGPGSWSSRLSSASGAPPQGNFFTAGMCIIVEAPTLGPVVTQFTKMIDVLTSPLP